MRIVLSIAGSDSIAGAGIQADLKTFAAIGVYGTTAVTAVTAQNLSGVQDVLAMPPDLVRSQIEAVAEQVSLAAVKTGMLATAGVARIVAETLRRLQTTHLVVDPVMIASSQGGRTLLAPDAVEIVRDHLLPLASVVTPNTEEARVLSGIDVQSLAAAREAAKRIFELGPRAVVMKGGHLEGPHAVDLLYDGRTFTEFSAPRSRHGSLHGTGCAFASAIAAGLALDDDVTAAVQRAKAYVTGAIEQSLEVGQSTRLLNHFWIYTGR